MEGRKEDGADDAEMLLLPPSRQIHPTLCGRTEGEGEACICRLAKSDRDRTFEKPRIPFRVVARFASRVVGPVAALGDWWRMGIASI